MKRSIRKAGVLGVFTAILAGMMFGAGITARDAEAHAELTEDEARGDARIHPPEAPRNLRIEGAAGRPDIAIQVSWTPGHGHERFGYYWITLYTNPLPGPHPAQSENHNCIGKRTRHIPGCIRREVRSGRSSYSETVSGLMPETTYYVHVAETWLNPRASLPIGYGASATITTSATPDTTDPETPDPVTPDPETPTTPDPETPTTPDPETPDCTYKHRLIGVPGTTGGGYTSQILISSEESNATATITAYQNDNGYQIDVLDSQGSAVGSTTSLAPAHSVKVFRLEGARGWHSVIVEHPTARAMRRATVAMRLREPDTGISIILAERIEDCEPAATTTE